MALKSQKLQIDDQFLFDDEKPGKVTYYLFCHTVKEYESPIKKKRKTVRSRHLRVIESVDREGCDEQLFKFMSEKGNELVSGDGTIIGEGTGDDFREIHEER